VAFSITIGPSCAADKKYFLVSAEFSGVYHQDLLQLYVVSGLQLAVSAAGGLWKYPRRIPRKEMVSPVPVAGNQNL